MPVIYTLPVGHSDNTSEVIHASDINNLAVAINEISGRAVFTDVYAKAQMRQFHRGLVGAAASPCDVVVIGDSETEGVGATTLGPAGTRMTEVLRGIARAAFQPSGVLGGEGYIPTYQVNVANRWTVTGGSLLMNWGFGRRARLISAAGNQLSLTVKCTGIDIFWAGNTTTGSFSWAIDGGAATTVNTVKAGPTGSNVTQIRGLVSGNHSLVIAFVSGSTVIEGIQVYDGDELVGVRIWEGGHSSYKTGDYVGLASLSGLEWIDSIGTIQPDLVIIALMVNDYFYSVDPATTKANLKTLMTNVRAKCTYPPSIALTVQPKRADAFTPAFPWSQYVAAVYAAAAEDGFATVINIDDRFWTGSLAPYATGVALLGVDQIHPTDLGYAVWAQAVWGVIRP